MSDSVTYVNNGYTGKLIVVMHTNNVAENVERNWI